MKWYIVRLVYQICNDSEYEQFDEQIRLVCAENEKRANEKMLSFGLDEEEEFDREDGARVKWKLVTAAIVSELPVKMEDGGMLFSSTYENEYPHGSGIEGFEFEHIHSSEFVIG